MGKGNELEIGKAGEHLVCANIIIQGYRAFLSDQGLPYDVIADIDGRLYKIQVKTTMGHVNYDGSKNKYRFSLRKAKHGSQRLIPNKDADILAFVILPINKIAFINVVELMSKNNIGSLSLL